MRAKVPQSESFRVQKTAKSFLEHSLQGEKVPQSESSREQKFHKANVSGNESSFL